MAKAESQKRYASIGFLVLTAISLALMLVVSGCASGKLGVVADANGVHINATGKASGTANAYLEVPSGKGIRIDPAISEGSILVKIADGRNVIRFESSMTGDTTVLVPDAWGECNMVVTARDAEGTIEIVPYDVPVEETDDESEEPGASNASKEAKPSSSDSASSKSSSSKKSS